MTVSYYTYDGSIAEGKNPHRPSTDDVGFNDLENKANNPPNPRTHPTAEAWNQKSDQIVGLGRMATMLRITVTFSGGTPSVNAYAMIGNNTVVLTPVDNGTGDTSVTWPANSYPAFLTEPWGATCNTALGIIRANSITNGVRVRTTTHDNTASDIGWTVCVG